MDASTLSDAPNSSWYSSLSGLLDTAVKTGTDLYTAKTGAQTAKAVANAEVAKSNATVLTSKNMLIAAAVVAVAVVAFVLLRKK